MEQKKFDLNSIIGFVLIFGILIWIMYQNQPDPKVVAAEKAQKELAIKQAKAKELEAKVCCQSGYCSYNNWRFYTIGTIAKKLR